MLRNLPNLRLRIVPRSQLRCPSIVHTKYDEETGQIFSEQTAKIQSYDDSEWCIREPLGLSKDVGNSEKRRHSSRSSHALHCQRSRSSATLLRMAVKCVVANILHVSLEMIQGLPIALVRQIWQEIAKSGPASFYVWTIFSNILRNDKVSDLSLLVYYGSISKPMARLSDFSAPLTSGAFAFIAALTIMTQFPMADLVSLTKLKNLGVIELINDDRRSNPANGIGDRLIRDWHLAVVNDGAFPVLRVLRLLMHQEVTEKSLAFISAFPALGLYDVRGCRLENKYRSDVKKLGWNVVDDQSPLLQLEALCLKRTTLNGEDFDLKAIRRHETYGRAFSDTAEVRMLPREQVPQYLAGTKAAVWNLIVDDSTDISNIGSQPEPQMTSSKSSIFYGKYHANEYTSHSWDPAIYQAFNRIGELRDDSDLTKAGISIGDQAIVGHELVSSVPFASLQLGQKPSNPERGNYIPGSAFIRVEIPPMGIQKQQNSGQAPSVKDSKEIAKENGSLTLQRLKPTNKQRQPVIQSRKRKLDDVLGSFA